MKELPRNVENHNNNLHGGKGFDGLTGFYKGTYYDKGLPRTQDSDQLARVREQLKQLGGER